MSKFEHIKDKFIRESLEEYKGPIDSAKPDGLSVSNYKVEKPWGHELWLELNEFYAYKRIHMKKEINVVSNHTIIKLKLIMLLKVKLKYC